jgi:hypothetical protein
MHGKQGGDMSIQKRFHQMFYKWRWDRCWEELQYNLGGNKVEKKTLKELVNEGFTPMHTLERDKWNKLSVEQQKVVLLHYTNRSSKVLEVTICEHERECDHLWLIIFMVK